MRPMCTTNASKWNHRTACDEFYSNLASNAPPLRPPACPCPPTNRTTHTPPHYLRPSRFYDASNSVIIRWTDVCQRASVQHQSEHCSSHPRPLGPIPVPADTHIHVGAWARRVSAHEECAMTNSQNYLLCQITTVGHSAELDSTISEVRYLTRRRHSDVYSPIARWNMYSSSWILIVFLF